MMFHYLGLNSASDWLKQITLAAQPIRSTDQNWMVTRHQYGISAVILQMLFCEETSGSIAQCWSLAQAA